MCARRACLRAREWASRLTRKTRGVGRDVCVRRCVGCATLMHGCAARIERDVALFGVTLPTFVRAGGEGGAEKEGAREGGRFVGRERRRGVRRDARARGVAWCRDVRAWARCGTVVCEGSGCSSVPLRSRRVLGSKSRGELRNPPRDSFDNEGGVVLWPERILEGCQRYSSPGFARLQSRVW